MIVFVGAYTQNYAVGKDGHLPWQGSLMQTDKARLHKLTSGKKIVAGERAYHDYQDIQSAFHTKDVIVISRSTNKLPDAVVVSDIQNIIELSKTEELWVIGGGSIFTQLLPYADKMFLTRIEAELPGDAFFPKYDLTQWQIENKQTYPADEKNPYPYTFIDLVRKYNIQ